jgi:electron transport complex protein RnfB
MQKKWMTISARNDKSIKNFFLFLEKFRVPEKLKSLIPKIFTEEEIILLNHLSDKENTVSNIYAKFPHFPPSLLKSIYNKGYLIRKSKKGEEYYKSSPFEEILKIFIKHSSAFQKLSDKDRAVCQECITDWSLKEMAESEEPVYRIIPIEITIQDKRQLIPYYQAKSYIQKSKHLALVDCLCRSTFQKCNKPIKVCLALNNKAEFFISNEMGERIDVQDGLEILDIAEKNGLVHSINNIKNPDYLCNCCECCCVFIQGLKKYGIFTSIGKSGFIAKLNAEMCNLCGLCVEMCMFKAISYENESIKINKDKCFGCGLCSYHCPQSAIQLILHNNQKTHEFTKS